MGSLIRSLSIFLKGHAGSDLLSITLDEERKMNKELQETVTLV
jgi:hypothetical protein